MAWIRSSLKASSKHFAVRSKGSTGLTRPIVSRRSWLVTDSSLGCSVSQSNSKRSLAESPRADSAWICTPAVLIRQRGTPTRISSVNAPSGTSSARARINIGDEVAAPNSDPARDDRTVGLSLPHCPTDSCRSIRLKQKSSGSPWADVWNSAARMPLPSPSSTNRSQAIATEWILSALRSSKGIGNTAYPRAQGMTDCYSASSLDSRSRSAFSS